MNLKGKILVIQDKQIISEKFSKQNLILKTEGEYPQEICIEFHQDRCDLLTNHKVGAMVDVGIDIRGRHWKDDKYFNTIVGWKIEVLGAATPPPAPIAVPVAAAKEETADFGDLPF